MNTTIRDAILAMESITTDQICQVAHHATKDQHAFGTPCPVAQRYAFALDALRRLQWNTITEDDILEQTLRMSLALDVGAFRLGAKWAEKELRRKNGYAMRSHP